MNNIALINVEYCIVTLMVLGNAGEQTGIATSIATIIAMTTANTAGVTTSFSTTCR